VIFAGTLGSLPTDPRLRTYDLDYRLLVSLQRDGSQSYTMGQLFCKTCKVCHWDDYFWISFEHFLNEHHFQCSWGTWNWLKPKVKPSQTKLSLSKYVYRSVPSKLEIRNSQGPVGYQIFCGLFKVLNLIFRNIVVSVIRIVIT